MASSSSDYEDGEAFGTGAFYSWLNPESEVDLFYRDQLAEERARKAELRVMRQVERERMQAEGYRAAERLWEAVQNLLRGTTWRN